MASFSDDEEDLLHSGGPVDLDEVTELFLQKSQSNIDVDKAEHDVDSTNPSTGFCLEAAEEDGHNNVKTESVPTGSIDASDLKESSLQEGSLENIINNESPDASITDSPVASGSIHQSEVPTCDAVSIEAPSYESPRTPSPPKDQSPDLEVKKDGDHTEATVDSYEFMSSEAMMPSPIAKEWKEYEGDVDILSRIEDKETFWDSSDEENQEDRNCNVNGPVDVDSLTESFLSSKGSLHGIKANLFASPASEEMPHDEVSCGAVDKMAPLEDPQPLEEQSKKPTAERSDILAVMSAIESKRRYWTTTELETMKVEWSTYRDLIWDMAKSTDAIAMLLQNHIQKDERYYDFLNAIKRDCLLNDSDKVVTNPRRSERLAAKRNSMTGSDQIKESSILEPLFQSLVQLAAKVDENIAALQADAQSMADLRSKVSSRATSLAQEGDKILFNLESSEAKIQQAWDRFDAIINRIENEGMRNYGDLWLAEVSYKNAVTHASLLWKVQSKGLKNLFEDTIHFDDERRNRTKEIILSFLPRQRRIFLRSVEVLDGMESELESGLQDKHQIDEQLDKALQELGRKTINTRNRSSIMNRSRFKKINFDDRSDIDSPRDCDLFESALVEKLSVLEVKRGAKPPWQVALAVTTVDKYLHLFLCNDDTCDMEKFKVKNLCLEETLKSEFKGSTPDVSIFLPECSCAVPSSKAHIELSFTGDGRLQTMLKRTTKLYLRLSSPSETSKWFEGHEKWSRVESLQVASDDSVKSDRSQSSGLHSC